MRDEDLHLDLSLVPDGGSIAMTQRVVEDLSRRILHDEDVGWRLAMVAHELLDNARKFGRGEVARLRFAIEPAPGGHSAHVNVESRSSRADIAHLKSVCDELAQSSDVQASYLGAMRRAALGHDDSSGLGLARICAEGEMALSVAVDDDCVVVHARLRVEGGRR